MKSTVARRSDIPAALLLFTALITSASRLFATGWTDGLGVAITLTIFGALLGLLLGASRFKRFGVILLSTGYSLFMIPWALGGAQYPGMSWLDRWINLSGRLTISYDLFLSGQPVEDPLLFITLAAAAFWSLSVHAGFALMRKTSFLGSVLPSGIVIFLVQIYDSWSGERIGLMGLYIFICLLLLGRLNYLQGLPSRTRQRVWISSAANKDLNIILTITALSIVLLAWVLPSSAQSITAMKSFWTDITKPWKEARENLDNAIAGLEHGESVATADYYSENLPLGRTGASGDSVLFTVRVPMSAAISRSYWVVRTYDEYNNGEWHETASMQRTLLPRNQALRTPDAAAWTSAEFIFTIPGFHLTILPTPPRPVWVNRKATLKYLQVSDELVEPLLISVDPPIQPGETYTVHASIANPTRVQLRAAGSDYPDWVTARYLQLPENFPEEIADLAMQVTSGESTPYDQATAITDHLRITIRYTQTITPAPDGYDPLAWFLFTSQEGFCNYYASTEVLMLRSVGIPARLAVGYSEGERQGSNVRIVRSRNAHAWPEVYFPGIGWVEFEPTSSEDPILRPSGETSVPASGENDGHETIPEEELGPEAGSPLLPGDDANTSSSPKPNSFLRLTIFLVAGLAVTIGVVLVILFGIGEQRRRRWYAAMRTPTPVLMMTALEKMSVPAPHWLQRWVRWSALGSVERAFTTVHRSLRWLGIRRDPSRTPAQAAELLIRRLPEATAQIQTLLNEYQRVLFSLQPGNGAAARSAAAAIRRGALRAAVRGRVHALQVAIRKGTWRKTARPSDREKR